MTRDGNSTTFLHIIRRSQRGRLKVYLGYCPGVGKTCEMLQEGHRLKKDGVDVVVGIVETHGRRDTGLLVEGLEVIPRICQEYRGVGLEEMDIAGILARRPAVVLIDELAHTNVPGGRNRKRYEDVQDILQAGIHVVTTLNVQHLESLYDTVETTIGVKVRERLPDSVFAEADQIVNVDITTQDLRRRLEEGKIYPVARIEAAQINYFRGSNLEQLREITLRELASQIDFRRRIPSEQDASFAPEQVMVCLSSAGPNSERLLRYASRLAGRLNRNWYALYVQTPSEDPASIDVETQRVLSDTLTLAKQLGAMVFTYKGHDVADTILKFAGEYRVGHVVVGSPARLSLWNRIQGRQTVADRLMHNAHGMTIVVLDTNSLGGRVGCISDRSMPAAKEGSPINPTPSLLCLSQLLSRENIVIWDEPVLKDEVINALVKCALCKNENGWVVDASRKVWEREQLGSTFFNEGVAFPHARLDGLSAPRIALGLTRHGIVDVAAKRPIEVVFLILSPAESPTAQLQMLALTSRAAQDRHFLKRLQMAKSPESVLETIADWEGSQ